MRSRGGRQSTSAGTLHLVADDGGRTHSRRRRSRRCRLLGEAVGAQPTLGERIAAAGAAVAVLGVTRSRPSPDDDAGTVVGLPACGRGVGLDARPSPASWASSRVRTASDCGMPTTTVSLGRPHTAARSDARSYQEDPESDVGVLAFGGADERGHAHTSSTPSAARATFATSDIGARSAGPA